MPNRFSSAATLLALAALAGCTQTAKSPASRAIALTNVLIVVGNHKMDAPHFFQIFDHFPELHYTVCYETQSAEAWSRTDLARFDTILLYDSQSTLTDAKKQTFLSLFDQGIGLVVMNHAVLSYQHWPDYERIVGGKYLLDTEHLPDGTTRGESHNKLNTDIPLTITDHAHPITAGLPDFLLHDELYRSVPTTPDVHVLITTKTGFAPDPQPQLWTRTEKSSRIVTLLFGDGPAYSDPRFQELLARSLHWTARIH